LCAHALLIQDARTCRTGFVVGTRELISKRRRAREHFILRRRRAGSGPRGNVVVECRSQCKHVPHISHFFCIPTPDVLVERRCAFKHITHSGHRRRVPLRNIAVECTSTTKACVGISIPSTHIRHQTRIPIWHRPVIITGRPLSALPCFWSFD